MSRNGSSTSSSDRSRRAALRFGLAAMTSLTLGACGFQPLYGRTGGGPDELAEIAVGVIADREGQILRGFLMESLNPSGRPAQPRFELSVGLSTSTRTLGIDRDDDIVRAAYSARASFTLKTSGGDADLLSRSISNSSSYNILQDQFATLSAEEAAQTRVMQQLANDIRTQLALYFNRGT